MSGDLYLKVLNADGSCIHGVGKWDIPKDGKPGKWKSVKGELVPCIRGLHLCRPKDLVYWLGPAIFVAEASGDERVVVDGENGKVVVRKARLVRQLDGWNERTARLFACDCAERVLPIYERDYPGEDRPHKAIEVARQYANGEATAEQLAAARDAARDATWDAARDAAWAAAWAAARAAAWDAQTADLLRLLGIEDGVLA